LRINPDTIPANSDIIPTYWILRNYGSNAQFSAPAQVWMTLPGGVPADLPQGAGTLYKRTPQGEGFTWQNVDQADQMPAGNNVSAGFTTTTQVRSSGQYYIGLPAWYPLGKTTEVAKDVSLASTTAETTLNIPSVSVFPNPASTETAIQINVETDEPCTIRVYDEQGRAIQIRQFVRSATLQPLSAGQYVYRVQNGHFMKIGKIVVH
jgi:Secretion system C-terminal sorting domain